MKDRNGRTIEIGSDVYYVSESVILTVTSFHERLGFPLFTGDDGGTEYQWVDPRQCEICEPGTMFADEDLFPPGA